MKSRIPALIRHDLALALKNKTFILLLCIPLFVYAVLKLTDEDAAKPRSPVLGYPADCPPPTEILDALKGAGKEFTLSEVRDAEEGTRLLRTELIDCLILPDPAEPERVAISVLKGGSPALFAVSRTFLVLQIAKEAGTLPWISKIITLRSANVSTQALPTWIVMVVLLVAFFILPAQVAEEKEKQWLSALLQTPMREGEWLIAKSIYGIFLMLLPTAALQILAGSAFVPLPWIATILLGGISFSAIGIALGLACRTQATARTLGVIFYLPLLLPVALSDNSDIFRAISRFLPSYALYNPVKILLLDTDGRYLFPFEWLFMAAAGTLALGVGHRLIKKRWLM